VIFSANNETFSDDHIAVTNMQRARPGKLGYGCERESANGMSEILNGNLDSCVNECLKD